MWFVEAVGLAAGLLGVVSSLPQTVKVLKDGHTVGVSVSSWVIIFCTYAAWFAFGLRIGSFSQWVTNLLAIMLASVLLYVLLKGRMVPLLRVLLMLFAAAVMMLVVFVLPDGFVGLFLGLFLFSRVPQIMSSFKSWRLGRVTNVSLLTFGLMVVSNVLWIVYGVLFGAAVIVVMPIIALTLSGLVLVFEVLAGRKAKAVF